MRVPALVYFTFQGAPNAAVSPTSPRKVSQSSQLPMQSVRIEVLGAAVAIVSLAC